MKSVDAVRELITGQGILPLFYHYRFDTSLSTVKALYRAGIRAVEYTNRGSHALENFTRLCEIAKTEMPDLLLGAGTIKSLSEGLNFIQAGARFLVSPFTEPGLGLLAARNGLLWIPGAMTPGEIQQAQQAGAILIKIFPASVLGPGFIKAVREVFSGLQFMPTGGVELSIPGLQTWFRAGASAVGLGGSLLTETLLMTGDESQIFHAATAALELLAQARGQDSDHRQV